MKTGIEKFFIDQSSSDATENLFQANGEASVDEEEVLNILWRFLPKPMFKLASHVSSSSIVNC